MRQAVHKDIVGLLYMLDGCENMYSFSHKYIKF
jgi:hypothetical protein